jgi:hypothetical protein
MIDSDFRQMFLLGIPLIAGAAWRGGRILQAADGKQKADRRQLGGMNASNRIATRDRLMRRRWNQTTPDRHLRLICREHQAGKAASAIARVGALPENVIRPAHRAWKTYSAARFRT